MQVQSLYTRLFVAGCSLQAVEAVAQTVASVALADPTGPSEPLEGLDGVGSLLDKSLVQQTEMEAEEPRLLMLEIVREYGLVCLREQGELARSQQAHAAYYLGLVEQAAEHQFGVEAGLWFALLEREQENIRAALQWALDHQEPENPTIL